MHICQNLRHATLHVLINSTISVVLHTYIHGSTCHNKISKILKSQRGEKKGFRIPLFKIKLHTPTHVHVMILGGCVVKITVTVALMMRN